MPGEERVYLATANEKGEVTLPPSVVSSSASSVKSASKMPVRALEEYSSESLVSGTTNCTAAINAALEDSGALDVPIQLLGKRYLTEGKHLLPSYISIRGVGCYIDFNLGSIFELEGGMGAVNVFQSEKWGSSTEIDSAIYLKDFGISANQYAQAEKGVNAMPQTYLTQPFAAKEPVAHVTSTEGFAASGLVWVGKWLIKYQSTTATEFKECTEILASTGTRTEGAWVTPHNSQGHCLALQAELCRCDNLSLFKGQASNLMLQGIPARIAYENTFTALKGHTANRFGVEIGEYATDNNFVAPVLGPNNGKGAALIRGADTAMVAPHLIGNQSPQQATIIVCAANLRIVLPNFDKPVFAGVRIDTSVRGGVGFIDPHIEGISGEHWNYSGAFGGSFIVTRRGGAEPTKRGRFTGSVMNSESPYYKYVYRSGGLALLVGAQNPKTLSTSEGGSGYLQVDTAAEFYDSAISGITAKVGTNTLTYTGKSTAIAEVENEIAANAGSIQVRSAIFNMSAGFLTGAGIIVAAGGPNNAEKQEVAYEKYNPATRTFEGCTGNVNAIPAEAQITQCFLLGCNGGATSESVAAGSTVSGPVQTMLNQSWWDVDAGTIHTAFSFNSTSEYNFKRGFSRNEKSSIFMGELEIPAGAKEASVAHNCFATPSNVQASPKTLLKEETTKTPLAWEVISSSGNITIKLSGKAEAAAKFFIYAECLPTS